MRAGVPYDRPSNEAMHRWMRQDAGKCAGNAVLDLGAGKLKNRPLFPGMRYIAVDLNERALATGKAEFPDAEIYTASISDFVPPVPVDVAVSTLVFENKYFPAERTISTVRHILRQIAAGGTFLFNMGPKNLVHENELDSILASEFAEVRKRPYGRFHVPVPFSGAVAAVMAGLGDMIVPNDVSKRRAYYSCWNRRATTSPTP